MDEVTCITGGTGFIGTHLANALPGAYLFRFPEMDLRNIEDATYFIDALQPEVLYHLAAQSVVTNDADMESLTTNVAGTWNLYHACRSIRRLRSIVHISTDKVYGDNSEAKTTDPLKGTDHPYNASKLCGDVVAQLYRDYYGLPIRIVRTGNIYGPGDSHWDRIVPGVIQATLAGEPVGLRSDGQFVRDYIYVGDLIPAYLRIANEPPGTYNLGGEPLKVIDLVRAILNLMGREDLQPVILNTQKNEIPRQHVVDCPEWWQPSTPLREGLERTIAWYSSRG